MKAIFNTLVTVVILVAAFVAFGRLRTYWDEQDRLARIDRAIEERKAWLEAEIAYRNQFAELTIKQAIDSEREAQVRWDAAKDRAKLPGDNTKEGFTPANTSAPYSGPPPRR